MSIWCPLTVCPPHGIGAEEAVLAGVKSSAPARTIVLGSTSADDRLAQLWWQMAAPAGECGVSFCGAARGGEAASEGVVIVCMRPSIDFTPIYSHGYHGTVHQAIVEATAEGDPRRIETLRPLAPEGAPPQGAAELFNRWTVSARGERL